MSPVRHTDREGHGGNAPRSLARRFAWTLVVAAGALVTGVTALAFWTSTGAAGGEARVGTLDPAAISATVTGAGVMTVVWDEPAEADPGSQSSAIAYTVERRLGAGSFAPVPAGGCSGTLSSATTSCADTLDTPGSYAYRVVAHLGSSWTAESNVVTVLVAFDTAPPATTITFPIGGATLDAFSYGAGCVPTGVCGSASDPSGVAGVRVSVRRESDGGYWTGAGFGGLAEYFLDAALLAPGAPTTAWSLPLPLPPDGAYTIRVQARDAAGNESAPDVTSSAGFAVDTVGPATTLATTPAAPDGSAGWFRRSSVVFTLAASDPAPGSGVASTAFRADGGAEQTYAGPVVVSTQGEHQIAYRSIDNAGNVGSLATTRIALDNVAPATALTLSPASPTGANGWYSTAPTFTLSASDAAAGVAATWYRIDAGPALAYGGGVTLPEGEHTVSYWSVDVAGNPEDVRTAGPVRVDTTAPTTAFATQPSAPDGANGWFRQTSVSFTLTGSDATSGVAARMFTLDGGAPQVYGGPVAITSPGDHLVTYWSVDGAGNAGTPASSPVKLDKLAPVTTLTTTPAAPDGANGWFRRSSVTLSFAAADVTSGVATTSYSLDGGAPQAVTGPVTIAAQGVHTVAYWSADVAGNVEIQRTATVKLDDVGPTSVLATAPASADGANGWFRSSVSFTLAATDATSGVASRLYRLDGGAPQTYTGAVTLGQGDHTVEHWAVDNAGNEGAHVTTRIKLDTTAPVTTLSTTPGAPDGANGWFRQSSVSFTLAATDAVSGVAARFYTIDGGPAQTYSSPVPIATQGDHTVTYWSQDTAGNVEAAKSTHVKLDNVAPTVSVSLTAAGSAALTGTTILYRRDAASGNRTFRVRATVLDTTSGPASAGYPVLTTSGWTHVAEAVVTTPGAGVYDSSPFTWTTSASNPAGYSFTVADQAGNTASQALTFANDQTAPTGALTLGPSPVGALLVGTTLYVRSSIAGSFTLVDSVTDSGSGPASAAFPAVGTSGWSHAAETVVTGTGTAPTVAYASSQYAWTAGAGNPSSTTVTSADRVGNTSTTTLPLAVDNTGPTGGALRVNGVDATAAGSASTDTDGSFTIATRTDYNADSGVGFATSVLIREQATLSGGACGAFGTPTTIAGAPAQSGLADGCYRYILTGADKLGNTASVSTTVKVVSVPVVTLTSVTSAGGFRERFSGTTTKLSGTITIEVTRSGDVVQTYSFPATSSPWSYVNDIFDLWIGLTFTARARQVDGDGNVSEWSDPITFQGF